MGVPLFKGASKHAWLQLVIVRIKSHFVSWMAFNLSLVGCIMLINSVILSSMINSFMIYRWPSSFLKELKTTIRNFFWTMIIDVSKAVTASWKKVHLPKEYSGLGVKSLKLFNRALHKKLTWKFIIEAILYLQLPLC